MFSQGRSLAAQQRHFEAIDFLKAASDKLPDDARVRYVLAYCQRGLGETDAAATSLSAACELERSHKNVDWSQLMENFQGPGRAWLETERRKQLAGPSRSKSGE